MIKSISFIARKSELSHDAFMQQWHDLHAPMCHDAMKVRAYTISTVAETRPHPFVPELTMETFDVVTMAWFDSVESRASAIASSKGKRLYPDVFKAIGRIRTFVTSEQYVVPLASQRPKMRSLSVIRRKPDLLPAEFRQEWAVVHAEMSKQISGLEGFTLSEIIEQADTDIPLLGVDGPVDGFAESWWDRSMPRTAAMLAERDAWFTHGASFIGHVSNYILEERVIAPMGWNP